MKALDQGNIGLLSVFFFKLVKEKVCKVKLANHYIIFVLLFIYPKKRSLFKLFPFVSNKSTYDYLFFLSHSNLVRSKLLDYVLKENDKREKYF